MPSTKSTSTALCYSQLQTSLMASQCSTAFTLWLHLQKSSDWVNLKKLWPQMKIITSETPSTRSFSIAWSKRTEQVPWKKLSTTEVLLEAGRMSSLLEGSCHQISKDGWCTKTTRSCSRWLKGTKRRVGKLLLNREIHPSCPPKNSWLPLRILRSRILHYFNTQAKTSNQVKEPRSIRIKSAAHLKDKAMTASNTLLLS